MGSNLGGTCATSTSNFVLSINRHRLTSLKMHSTQLDYSVSGILRNSEIKEQEDEDS